MSAARKIAAKPRHYESRLKKAKTPTLAVAELWSPKIISDFAVRMEAVRAAWLKAGHSVDPPDENQLLWLTVEISACVAQAVNENEEQRNARAREAIKVLREWAPPGLTVLDIGLSVAEQIAEPRPAATRAWVHRAHALWGRVNEILKARGGKAGVSATSHAVLFVSAVLQMVGHPAATVYAVSMQMRAAKPSSE